MGNTDPPSIDAADLETYFDGRVVPRGVSRRLGLRTRAIHGRRRRGPGPLITPIYASSTWALASARQGAELAVETAPAAYYTRWGNPTLRELEDALADLEGGARGLVTGSGMGAIASAILTSVDAGDHVVAGASLYTATTEIFTRLLPPIRHPDELRRSEALGRMVGRGSTGHASRIH